MQPTASPALRERHAKRRQREQLLEARAQRPANHAAHGQSKHRVTEPARTRRTVGAPSPS